MKKGFTMIELIFVIVILGVLASVAIPRLAATRDDAEVAKAATNLATAVTDIAAYYTAKGSFNVVEDKTNTTKPPTKKVAFKDITNALDNDGNLIMKSETCAKVYLPGTTGSEIASGEVKLEIRFTGKDPACTTLQSLSSIKTLCGALSDTSTKGSDGKPVGKNCKVQIGGSGGIAW